MRIKDQSKMVKVLSFFGKGGKAILGITGSDRNTYILRTDRGRNTADSNSLKVAFSSGSLRACTTAMEGTVLSSANNVPLTPISFLQRSAVVYPDRIATVASSGGGSTPRTWRETWARCLSLAAALVELGATRNNVVIN
jgi:hypothetical protein